MSTKLPGTPKTNSKFVLFILVIIVVLIQGLILTFSSIAPLASRILEVGMVSKIERSAVLGFNQSLYQYVDFLIRNTPEESVIAIPPDDIDPVLGNEGLMQYFLFPRRITNCPAKSTFEACLHRFRDRGIYIMVIEDFSPDSSNLGKEYLPFIDGQGLYFAGSNE